MSTRVDKPWGHELIWAHTAAYVGKILHVRAGEALFSSVVRDEIDDDDDLPLLELPALQLRGRAAPVQIFCLPAAERIDLREV